MPRWNFEYNQEQQFANGFRMVADVTQISDFDYYTDFVKELKPRLLPDGAGAPGVLAQRPVGVDQRAGTAPRATARRRLGTGAADVARGRVAWPATKKLGKTPIYFGYQSSIALIQQQEKPLPCTAPPCTPEQLAPLDADYSRFDVFPTFSLPLAADPPGSTSRPSVSYRVTRWSQRFEEITLGTGDMTRVAADTSITTQPLRCQLCRSWGPSSTVSSNARTAVRTSTRSSRGSPTARSIASSGPTSCCSYDDVDTFNGSGASMNYSIVQRLFAKRPRQLAQPGRDVLQPVVLADGTTNDPLADDVSLVDPTEGFAPQPQPDARGRAGGDRDVRVPPGAPPSRTISASPISTRDGVNEATSPVFQRADHRALQPVAEDEPRPARQLPHPVRPHQRRHAVGSAAQPARRAQDSR